MATATAPQKGGNKTNSEDLPLKGDTTGGEQKSIDGKATIKAKADPKVVEKAKEYAAVLDKIEDLNDEANANGQALLEALIKSKGPHKVKVDSRYGFRIFSTKNLTKLVKSKEQTDR